jgi:guanylate kinase
VTALPHRACAVVLAAPSGTGKTTIARALVGSGPEFVFSVSVTTRPPRGGERGGVDYRFVDRGTFDGMVKRGELLEWAEVHGHLYGTPRANVEEASRRGEHVVLDIDVQGARQIRARVPDALLIFVFPPSADVLERRLSGRATEDEGAVAWRLRNARTELEAASEFDYVVVNDDLGGAVRQVRELVRAEGHRPDRALDLAGAVERVRSEIDRILADGEAPREQGVGEGRRRPGAF